MQEKSMEGIHITSPTHDLHMEMEVPLRVEWKSKLKSYPLNYYNGYSRYHLSIIIISRLFQFQLLFKDALDEHNHCHNAKVARYSSTLYHTLPSLTKG